MLSPESPFRRLPKNLERRQVLFADALRLSAEMAAFSYYNLENFLKTLVASDRKGQIEGAAIQAIAHAYGVIDSANRFREVLRSFPGLKQNFVFQAFIRGTASVEALRDVIQHLNSELVDIGEKRSAALGTLTWLGPSDDENSPPTLWILQPGSFYRGQVTLGPMIDLEARIAPGEVSRIRLVTSGVQVDLQNLIDRIRTMITSLEPSLREQSIGKDHMGSDILMQIPIRPASETDGILPQTENEG